MQSETSAALSIPLGISRLKSHSRYVLSENNRLAIRLPIVGMLVGMGSVGWTVVPSIMGAVAKRRGVPQAFLVAAICALILLGVLITHVVYASRSGM